MIEKAAFVGVAAILSLSALASARSEAADKDARFSVRGLGTTSCTKYLDAAESEEFVHWITGFLTAYNWLTPDTYDIAPQYNANGLKRFMDLYCGQNPKRRIIEAALAFVSAIHEKRARSGS
jgi:hypothetical protein